MVTQDFFSTSHHLIISKSHILIISIISSSVESLSNFQYVYEDFPNMAR